MPGPVSDSFDPEFGTGENARIIEDAILAVRDKISKVLDDAPLLPIVEVCRKRNKPPNKALRLYERELRIIRFALIRTVESL
jgi:hypothetical protein